MKCTHVVKDSDGEITEIHCTLDPASRGGNSPDGRKVQGTIHWVSATKGEQAEVRLYDRLFVKENPDDAEEGKDFKDYLNADSLKLITAVVEPYLKDADTNMKYQFERIGYFCFDKDSSTEKLVFNRTVTLKDSWTKQATK
ncbi:MAG: hypothetical protein A2491_05295 [Bacteroidetes bacterium RIFOXYC12_FULL_35_7]|nr:MAG: hypothetical protein A2491_05295 [Bacteroidetes bacterium RIFOXYC12_FULL_35_7]